MGLSVCFGFEDGEDSLVQGLLDFVEVGLVAKGAQCAEHSADFFVGEGHENLRVRQETEQRRSITLTPPQENSGELFTRLTAWL